MRGVILNLFCQKVLTPLERKMHVFAFFLSTWLYHKPDFKLPSLLGRDVCRTISPLFWDSKGSSETWKTDTKVKCRHCSKKITQIIPPPCCHLYKVTGFAKGVLWMKSDEFWKNLFCWIPQTKLCYEKYLANLLLHLSDKSAHGYIAAHPSVSVKK